jgi:hypothetical protein
MCIYEWLRGVSTLTNINTVFLQYALTDLHNACDAFDKRENLIAGALFSMQICTICHVTITCPCGQNSDAASLQATLSRLIWCNQRVSVC